MEGQPMYMPPGKSVISYPPSNVTKSSDLVPVQCTI
ncbi:hypothetical protein NC653_038203 [Populus alba x Populus x berolinensis]|uniref:Uncharacterized protein n=1 Tax=Populus alba x Populus x berolinensis TaxID=444605 RepID=A0AAD6PUJ1_9ROSI|nr:hypothetical protein NC653_038203 [Populus alba x Populus x berolinensis]